MIDFEKDVENCLQVLRKGGVILYPTDSIWGLGCDATNDEAVEKIYRIKCRPENKSMIVLVADERNILKYVTQPDPQVFSFLKSVSRPTTVIYYGAIGLANHTIGEDGTVAMRITKEPFTKALIKRFQKPVVSTSANISGKPSPATFTEISELIKESADYVVSYRQEEDIMAKPSALVKWNRDGTVTRIRS